MKVVSLAPPPPAPMRGVAAAPRLEVAEAPAPPDVAGIVAAVNHEMRDYVGYDAGQRYAATTAALEGAREPADVSGIIQAINHELRDYVGYVASQRVAVIGAALQGPYDPEGVGALVRDIGRELRDHLGYSSAQRIDAMVRSLTPRQWDSVVES